MASQKRIDRVNEKIRYLEEIIRHPKSEMEYGLIKYINATVKNKAELRDSLLETIYDEVELDPSEDLKTMSTEEMICEALDPVDPIVDSKGKKRGRIAPQRLKELYYALSREMGFPVPKYLGKNEWDGSVSRDLYYLYIEQIRGIRLMMICPEQYDKWQKEKIADENARAQAIRSGGAVGLAEYQNQKVLNMKKFEEEMLDRGDREEIAKYQEDKRFREKYYRLVRTPRHPSFHDIEQEDDDDYEQLMKQLAGQSNKGPYVRHRRSDRYKGNNKTKKKGTNKIESIE